MEVIVIVPVDTVITILFVIKVMETAALAANMDIKNHIVKVSFLRKLEKVREPILK
jgi:hypothetical protein